jgi:hypothetical protein
MYSTKTKQQQQRSDAAAAAAAKGGQGRAVRPPLPQGQDVESEVQQVIRAAAQHIRAALAKQVGKGSLGHLLNLKRDA